MGYIRKHKDGIRTGFELIFLMSGILLISPFIIYLNNNLELPKPKIVTVNIPNSHKKYAITWFSLAL